MNVTVRFKTLCGCTRIEHIYVGEGRELPQYLEISIVLPLPLRDYNADWKPEESIKTTRRIFEWIGRNEGAEEYREMVEDKSQ